MGNYRRGRQLACPELEVNSSKRKMINNKPHLKSIKRPKKAEVNYLPLFPFGETEETLEKDRVDLLSEFKKRDNDKVVDEKMEKMFSNQRLEVVNHCHTVPDAMERWLALFCESQLKNKFRKITTIHLEQTFLTNLDYYTPKLLSIFTTKGGITGTKIRRVLDSVTEQLEDRRDAAISCLIHYLGESCEELITDYQDISKDVIKDGFAELVMKIIVLSSAAAEECDHCD